MSLLLHETQEGRGELMVDVADGELVVLIDRQETHLPVEALERVMERYGKPLDDGVSLEGPSLDMGKGRVLRRIRHRGFYDVIARDFVVLERPGQEPLVELATAVSAALAHLARAAGG